MTLEFEGQTMFSEVLRDHEPYPRGLANVQFLLA